MLCLDAEIEARRKKVLGAEIREMRDAGRHSLMIIATVVVKFRDRFAKAEMDWAGPSGETRS